MINVEVNLFFFLVNFDNFIEPIVSIGLSVDVANIFIFFYLMCHIKYIVYS